MLAHTQAFKDAFTSLGRDLKIRIGVYGNYGQLTSEDSKMLLTESNVQLISDVTSSTPLKVIDENNVISLTKNNLGELYRTFMKSFDLKTTTDLEIGTLVDVKIGTTVNNDVEYLNYGYYYVYSKTYDKVDKTYEYQLCDDMLKTMIKFYITYMFNVNENYVTFSTAISRLLQACQIQSSDIQISNLVNGSQYIYRSSFEGMDMTCRDVLDMIMQLTGTSLIVDNQRKFRNIGPSASAVDTIDEDILKDTVVDFEDKFGPLNALVFTRASGQDSIRREDSQSILDNGECEYIVKDNLIADQDNRTYMIDNMFNKIKGLEYYVSDLETVGVGYIEYLDNYNVQVDGETYKCLCLQNTANLESGMVEDFKGESPEEQKHDYNNVGIDDKNATFTLDKMKGEAVLKVKTNGKLAQVRLDTSADSGSSVSIEADDINFSSHTFNLTTDDINIVSDNFGVDDTGYMWCTNANITGGYVNIQGDVNTASIWVRGTGAYSSYYSYLYPDHTDVTDGTNSCVCYPTKLSVWTTNSNDKSEVYNSYLYVGTSSNRFQASKNDLLLGYTSGRRIVMTTSPTNPYLTVIKANGTYSTVSADTITISNGGNKYIFATIDNSSIAYISVNNNGHYTNLYDEGIYNGGGKLYINDNGAYEENGYLNAGNLAFGENNLNANSGNLNLNTDSSHNVKANGVNVGGTSDRRAKENIKELDDEDKEKLLEEIRNLNVYSYDFKEEYGGQKDNVGIIIQDFEDNEILGKVLHIIEYLGIKKYNHEDLSQVNLILIKTLIEKIDKLEAEIKELKEDK